MIAYDDVNQIDRKIMRNCMHNTPSMCCHLYILYKIQNMAKYVPFICQFYDYAIEVTSIMHFLSLDI